MNSVVRGLITAASAALLLPVAHADTWVLYDLGPGDPVAIAGRDHVLFNLAPPKQRAVEMRRSFGWARLDPGSVGIAMNDHLVAVGTRAGGIPTIWPSNRHAKTITLPEGAVSGTPASVNNQHQVVGSYRPQGGDASRCFLTHADGKPSVDLGLLGDGRTCAASAINGATQVTGQAATAGANAKHAFFWSAGNFIDLGTLAGSTHSTGQAINPLGEVVGTSFFDHGRSHAVWWNSSHVMTDLDPAGQYYATEATQITNADNIFGWAKTSADGPQIAVQFKDSTVIALASEVTNIGDWILETAMMSGDGGIIVGRARHASGDQTPHFYWLQDH